ncbi:MAG: 4-hydroxy-3-methylbut-2-enyl diphosphate reductase [Tidjanibacter sp.]|nr:4-hydroxy-3-methylbut-2-enyl diphosphate reductase [Tidjanibacter sp.]
MRVEIDEKSGFCYGVVGAISKADELVAKGRRVFSLGDIVHNDLEVARLQRAGVATIGPADLASIEPTPDTRILIRAHGEPKSTYALLEQCGLKYADATCPVVAKLQRLTIEADRQMGAVGGTVVILGKKGHAEVVGLNGQIEDRGIVVEKVADLEQVDFSKPIFLLSQTTQSLRLFAEVKEEVLRRSEVPDQVVIKDTICRQVAGREEHLKAFAREFDVIVFVCGAKSSNGKVLFEACHTANPRSIKVEGPDELSAEMFEGVESVGICGATSTPHWLMKEVERTILELTSAL